MERYYTVSKDKDSGLWYAHLKGYSYVPVFGSFSERKADAMEYAKMRDCLPNRVSKIEERRRAQWEETT